MDKLLYNKNVLVARIDGLNHFHWVCKECGPLYLQITENLSGWLQNRCVDSHRRNSRLLKRALRISEKDDEEIVLEVNAASITDTYWIKDADSSLTWEQVNFKKAEFSSLALIGTYNYYHNAEQAKTKKTPELTNIGSFEKCWRVRNGEWWIYKEGNTSELFSELFAYKLGKALGFNMAEYKLGSRYIRPGTRYVISRDFTQGHKYNFEPIVAIVGNKPQDYKRTYQKIYELSPDAASDYVSILFMDALIFNPDRHEYNFGLLTNPDTGEIVGLAPNFDNNMALISGGYPFSSQRKGDSLIQDFNELLDSGIQWNGYSEYKTLPKVDEQLIKSVIREIGLKVREKFIIEFVMSSYRAIGWNKKMTIEKIQGMVRAKEYPNLLKSKNSNDNEALQLVTEDVFYIPPTIEVIREEKRPQVMIFSAAGATGKSALAKYLAKSFKCIYWDLSKTSVGENSFYGKLDKVLGRKNVDDFQSQMAIGEAALIIDAFDEAEIRRGRSDIQLFLDDIAEFVEEFEVPSMVLLSRSENARFLDEYLASKNINIVHYQIGLIDEENGKKFIEQLLERKKRHVTSVIKRAIEEEFASITKFLNNDARAFLGYAPVLEALTELIYQERNTINLVQNLKNGDKADKLFEKIMRDLLVREQQKFTCQLQEEWKTEHPQFDKWAELYSIDEQIYDILNYACFNELCEDVFTRKLPDDLRKDYKDAVNRFLPSHPFIRQKRSGEYSFSGPAFRDFSIVYGLLSNNDDIQTMAIDVLERQDKTSPLLAEFYSAMIDTQVEERPLDNRVFPYIYDSCKAAVRNKESTGLIVNASGDICYAAISTRAGQKTKELRLKINCRSRDEADAPILILPSMENASVMFPGKVVIQGIIHEGTTSSTEVSIENSYINADVVDFRTDKILFVNREGTNTQIEAASQINVQPSVDISGATENSLRMYAPNVQKDYRLRKYYFDDASNENSGLVTFSHIIRIICVQFSFGKSRTISIMEKLFLRDHDSDKAKIFSFLVAQGCITTDGADYTLNLNKMSALNISWSPMAQNDMVMYEDAYTRYQKWMGSI